MMTKKEVEQFNKLEADSQKFGQALAKKLHGKDASCLGSGSKTSAGKMHYCLWVNGTTKTVTVPISAHWDQKVLDNFISRNVVSAESRERKEFQRLREKYCGNPCDV